MPVGCPQDGLTNYALIVKFPNYPAPVTLTALTNQLISTQIWYICTTCLCLHLLPSSPLVMFICCRCSLYNIRSLLFCTTKGGLTLIVWGFCGLGCFFKVGTWSPLLVTPGSCWSSYWSSIKVSGFRLVLVRSLALSLFFSWICHTVYHVLCRILTWLRLVSNVEVSARFHFKVLEKKRKSSGCCCLTFSDWFSPVSTC